MKSVIATDILQDIEQHSHPGITAMSTISLQRPNQSQADWQIKVQDLILTARKYPQDSRQRNQCLTQVIRIVAPKLWKFYTPQYADALQQTWLYFIKNVCTAYDPTRASIVTWLNTYLRYRHQDLVNETLKKQYMEVSIDVEREGNDGTSAKVFELPTRNYGSLSLLDELVEWVQSDVDGELQRTHLKGRPDVNCRSLILLRLPPETPWKEMSEHLGVPIPTLSSFYRRHCIPYLRRAADAIKTFA
ncbi:MAG: sigma-70 family RNA polymerase sigma factor [Leptolyngbyaceae cyanobacterium bins.349]|nr:sigma-70 family RNA polymerase sigma factor [Leptolyngbyaceae cyanobacterium bins.349]